MDGLGFAIARVDDEEAHHAHRDLGHLIRMRVIHVGAVLPQSEFVSPGLTGRDGCLGQSTDAVHSIWQQQPVPMHAGVLGQTVGDQNANAVALDGFDGWARRGAVVAPDGGA